MPRQLSHTLAVLLVVLSTIPTWCRDPSTAEERQQAMQYVQQLEADPLANTAADKRKWLLAWMRDVPDISFITCVPLVRPLLESNYEYKNILAVQLECSSAAYILEHPEKNHLTDIKACSLAGLQGMLTAYESILKVNPKASNPYLDELLAKKAVGELEEYVAMKCK